MNYLVFMLVIAMCFGLNEGCNVNTLELLNQLSPGSILKVNCSSNRNHVEPLQEVKFNGKYRVSVFEKGLGERIVWRCLLRHGNKVENSQTIWRAYRGAREPRCGEIRSWIAKVDGIYMEKNLKSEGLRYHWIVTKK
ncbi:S-protein homolog 14-like [Raphanus sativus]|uniref:S-protein homolog 14-like n=1 Tax=Raphanus sativus TaxID=3726 RepID=A0A6J0L1S1_RAPSA|nr:S-protein homolog 14-like [Raphanus sativus]